MVSFVSEGRAASKPPGKLKQDRSLSPKCFSETIPSVPESVCVCVCVCVPTHALIHNFEVKDMHIDVQTHMHTHGFPENRFEVDFLYMEREL